METYMKINFGLAPKGRRAGRVKFKNFDPFRPLIHATRELFRRE
jgi:hypothetical protein